VRVVDRAEPMVRVRHKIGDDGTALAALVPGDLLIPQAAVRRSLNAAYARVTSRDGTLIAEAGARITDDDTGKERIVTHQQSGPFGLVATVSISSATLMANYADLQTFAAVGTAGVAVMILGFAALSPWRRRGNPIADLERALEKNEFVPYYQPIVDIKTGRILGAEVLIRWRRPDGTLVLPANFIPLAESSDLILEITHALMRAVCKEMGEAYAQRPHLKIGFNLAARHFLDDRVVEDVRGIFESSPIRLWQIILEVTERRPLENLTAARRVIAGLQGLGCQVAIDDVGAGHGGLSYLLKLGVDIIKIDKLFVDAIGTERHSDTIIETIVDLARSMRMDIVAEGVETFEQVTYLRERGIHQAQGYVFAPPLPGSSFLQLIAAIDQPAAKASGQTLAGPPRTRGSGAAA